VNESAILGGGAAVQPGAGYHARPAA
jgi:hypothetical protein